MSQLLHKYWLDHFSYYYLKEQLEMFNFISLKNFMHNSFIFFITSFALLSLSACQSLEKVKCEENNWRQQAYVDALEGQTLDEATPTLKRCKERFNVDIR